MGKIGVAWSGRIDGRGRLVPPVHDASELWFVRMYTIIHDSKAIFQVKNCASGHYAENRISDGLPRQQRMLC